MRRRRSRLETCRIHPRVTVKDSEGTMMEEYQDAYEVEAETWPASGKVQAQIYANVFLMSETAVYRDSIQFGLRTDG